ncbi:Hypothetical predicted protein [Cloeon dipterum]|uniref:Uncharacterized protein n=1 Tax=Cloeon dipterum TaxID=197152 RepID=A0A8S1DGJ9_9INSE|nr:Hypothetical predicted protein [Cloeon dipterum]
MFSSAAELVGKARRAWKFSRKRRKREWPVTRFNYDIGCDNARRKEKYIKKYISRVRVLKFSIRNECTICAAHGRMTDVCIVSPDRPKYGRALTGCVNIELLFTHGAHGTINISSCGRGTGWPSARNL